MRIRSKGAIKGVVARKAVHAIRSSYSKDFRSGKDIILHEISAHQQGMHDYSQSEMKYEKSIVTPNGGSIPDTSTGYTRATSLYSLR